jgi:uncharacterized protein YfaS (alpha-2-macroglobulin family)
LRRRIVLLAVSLSLLVLLVVVFLNVTETDGRLREVLRSFVPQQVQDTIRPLRAPMVIGYSPEWEATDVPLRSPVSITFLTPMNSEATLGNVSIEPSVEGDFAWSGSTLVFKPREDWPMETEVTVSVGRDARSWLLRRMERGFTFRFTTVGPPVVTATEPSQEARFAYLLNRLAITFSRPMDHDSVENRLTVTPEVSGQKLAWSEETLLITGALKPSTEYRLVIGKGARDSIYGIPTGQDFEWTFVTTERLPYLAILGTGREALLTAGTASTLELSLVNVSRIDVGLYTLDVPTYISMTNFSSEDWRQFSPEQVPLSSWSLDPGVTLDRDEQRDLALEPLEPGIYFLAVVSPEGVRDSQILVSTQTALTVKRTRAQVLVWATSIADGHPVQGSAITLYDESAEVLAAGVSDDKGVFVADLNSPPGVVHAVAEGEGGFGLCSDGWDQGIEPWRFEDVLWRSGAGGEEYKVFLYTDRPTYSPGDTVNFRGILRRNENGVYVAPRVGDSVHVVASGYGGNLLYEADLESSPFGTIHGAFGLSDELEDGEYYLAAEIGGEEFRASFQVQQLQEETFTVGVAFGSEEYMTGDVISATISARYAFQVPLVGATVEYSVYASDLLIPEEAGREETGPGGWSSSESDRREISAGTGLTDGDGEFQVSLRGDAARGDASQVLSLEATVADIAGQQVTGDGSAVVHRGEFYIDLLPDGQVASRGQRVSVDLRTLDTAGHPLGHVDLFYTVSVSEWRRVPRTVGGHTYADWAEIVSEAESSAISTDDQGKATIAFVPRQGGPYRLEVRGRDSRGNEILVSMNLWVSDPDRDIAWHLSEQDRVELVVDRSGYRAGDTAKVLIQSPYRRAWGLVTVERDGVLDHSVIELQSNSPILEIPLEASYAPNVYVGVVLVPRDTAAGDVPSFKVGYTQLIVQSPEDVLRVSVTPDKERYESGEMATYTLRSRDYLDRPVGAEISLQVVDASAFSSGEDAALDVLDAFDGRRQLAVRTTQSLTMHVDRPRVVEDYGGGGGIAEQEPVGVSPDVAYWNPAIVTDEQGLATVTFRMPYGTAVWRAVAAGITIDGRVGTADVEVSAQKPLAVAPRVPSVLCVGDETVIAAVVENHTADSLDATLILTSTGGLQAQAQPRVVAVKAGESVLVEWRAQAREAGPAAITVMAEAGELRDVAQRSLSVLPFGEATVVLGAEVVQGEASWSVNLPAGVESASLEIDVAPSLAAALAESAERLAGSSHDTVEQSVSRFLPGLEVSRVLAEQEIDAGRLAQKLPVLVEDSLQRLYRLQNRDGGWGWWEGDESRAPQTAYVVLGLSRARAAGYEVNGPVLEAALDFLRQSLLEIGDADTRAYLSYVLAECDQGDLSLARSLAERRNGMDLYAQAYLALALHTMGDTLTAQSIVEDLLTEVKETAHTAHWTEEGHDLAALSSDGRTTAAMLRALLAVDPANPLVPKSVQWFMWGRQGGYWGTTYESAEIIMALAGYLEIVGERDEGFTYRVLLNDELLTEEAVSSGSGGAYRELSIADLVSGDNRVTVASDGPGDLYVASSLSYSSPRETLEAARSLDGPVVQRQYEDAQSGEPLEQYQVGEYIRVRLTVECPADAWYVLVEDPLPPGTEPVEVTRGQLAPDRGEAATTRSVGVVREGKAVFYTTSLRGGTYEYTYLVRATTPGQYRIMPAEVKVAYDPEIWGRSGSATLRIAG